MKVKYLKRKIANFNKNLKNKKYYRRKARDNKAIVNRDMTIISNNCWGGKVYQYLDMPYLSPTVGLYFYADDYIKLIYNLKEYMATELEFISYEKSKYKDILKEKNQTSVPIGILGDIEVIFLHYKTEEEAMEKWNRRRERINWDNIFIKFSRMNQCSEEHIEKFAALPFDNKILLNTNKKTKYPFEYYWKYNHETGQISADTDPFPGDLNLVRIFKNNKKTYKL